MAVRHFSTSFLNNIAKAGGASIADTLANCVIGFYDGSMPTNADATEGVANLLFLVTLSSGAFTGGVGTNGLNFNVATAGILYKAVGEVWSGVGLAAASTGTVTTWCRIYDNSYTTGADTTSARIDLDVGSGTGSGASVSLGSTTIVEGATTTLDNANIPLLFT